MIEQALLLMGTHIVKKGTNHSSLFAGRLKRPHGPDSARGPPFGHQWCRLINELKQIAYLFIKVEDLCKTCKLDPYQILGT